jgi:hypothetical protein
MAVNAGVPSVQEEEEEERDGTDENVPLTASSMVSGNVSSEKVDDGNKLFQAGVALKMGENNDVEKCHGKNFKSWLLIARRCFIQFLFLFVLFC